MVATLAARASTPERGYIGPMRDAATVCAYLAGYAAPSLSDLTDAHLALVPAPNAKSAGWLLGHLCVTGDYIRRKCGRPPLTPKDWGPKFAPGSTPSADAADYPRMTELRTAFDAIYRDLPIIAPTLTKEVLEAANSLEFTRGRFPTFGAFACYIMTGHLGYHLGQLSGWRSAAGLPLRPGAAGAI